MRGGVRADTGIGAVRRCRWLCCAQARCAGAVCRRCVQARCAGAGIGAVRSASAARTVARFLKVPSGGPPVPERLLFASFEYGQPNWSMKLGMTRWKWRPL